MSEFVKDVSDSSFEKDVLGADKPVLVDFWAEMVCPLPHACTYGRSRGRALW